MVDTGDIQKRSRMLGSGHFGPGICIAGPVMVNHPEKVRKSLLKCQGGESTRL